MQTLEFGTWPSPISAAIAAAGGRNLSQLRCDGDALYWVESRPSEAGRQTLLRFNLRKGQVDELTPAPANARSRVHEYGGGAYVAHAGAVYFSEDADRQLHRIDSAHNAEPLTKTAQRRYADICVDARRSRLLCVVEAHGDAPAPDNFIVAIDSATGEQRTLLSGCDFYSNPRLTPSGDRLAWMQWSHPNMPWDASELWVADVSADGSLRNAAKVAGGAQESIFQPEWDASGNLNFISDRSGYWNLYRCRDGAVQVLFDAALDFGRAQWVFGMTCYAALDAQRIACAYVDGGLWRLALLDTSRAALRHFDLPFSEISYVCADAENVYCIAASPRAGDRVLRIDPNTGAYDVLYACGELSVDASYISQPTPITFPSANNAVAHAFYYAPTHPEVRGEPNTAPPLLVIGHGGPTAATSTALNLGIQFWTSRGFAVVDVNYRGSTGYGRAYRDALNGAWGVVDVEDCAHAALHLAEQGWARRDRMAIRGRSAGGFTVLAALTFFDVFSAGASYYGVSDLEALATDTHKFEARYLDRLVGPYPEQQALYQARSPISHCDRLHTPLIFFQGLEDKVVPPNQAERMVDALRAKGVPVAYVTFANEQHGFRRAENVHRTLEAELYFYGKIFGFAPHDTVTPVAIENLHT